MKKGFVLLETIVVISVLCVTLVVLYVGFSNVINNARSSLNFDNTEYIYKTLIIDSYLKEDIDEAWIRTGNKNYVYVFLAPKNTFEEYKDSKGNLVKDGSFKDPNISNDRWTFYNNLFEKMHVKAVYITAWNTKKHLTTTQDRNQLNSTVVKYIDSLNPRPLEDTYRLIVMYETENETLLHKRDANTKEMQVASVEFLPKKNSLIK